MNGASHAILADLNDAQRAAVNHRDGPLLVLAGPGSGKTRVITRRTALLVESGVVPRHILAITFTNKAAAEMKRRIEELGVARGMWIHTFHALGVRLLSEFGPLARVQPGFSIYDEDDQRKLMKEALRGLNLNLDDYKPADMRAQVSAAKNRLQTPAALGAHLVESGYADRSARRMVEVYERYEALLAARNAVDFDDLLMRVALVLRTQPEIVERLNLRFRYVLIDEYQDTNHAQYVIARALSQHHRNLCVTGDPDQSIYAWRGADIRNILDFERDYPDAVVVRLEQNYRSTGRILQVASALIQHNRRRKHKALWSELPAGDAVRVCRFGEGRQEAEFIADEIQQMHRNASGAYSDVAIMYRVNALSRGLEEALRHRAIPYRIARGVAFYNRKEIKDTLAYLHVVVNPSDEVNVLRIVNTPPRGIGKTTVDRLVAAAQRLDRPLLEIMSRADEHLPAAAAKKVRAFVTLLERINTHTAGAVADAVRFVLAASGIERELTEQPEDEGEDRLANVYELVTAAARYDEETAEPSLADFLHRVSLVSDQDSVDETSGCVQLLTLHAAKGLEFPIVFIVGWEQGLLPHARALFDAGDVEEERRLAFVGITRARRRLFLTHVQERQTRGVTNVQIESQFLGELGDEGLVLETRGTLRFSPARPMFADDATLRIVPLEDGGEERLLGEDELAAEGERPRRRLRPVEPDEIAIDADTAWRRAIDRDAHVDSDPSARDDAPRGRTGPPKRPGALGRRHTTQRNAESDPPKPSHADAPAFTDWKEGTLVRHGQYGVGQIVWIQRNPGQTRAGVKFAGYGEKTLILEFAKLVKLERGAL
ncbi:MAG: ATP-dependent helicase [Phycisphaerae bacterium]